jgi:hypothetical protein
MQALQVLSSKQTHMTKRPLDIFKCNEIADKTDATFIINVRDPRDVLTSIHANSEGRYKVNWNYSLKTSPKGVCGKTHGLLDYWKKIPEVPDPIIIYYENLVLNTLDEQLLLETHFPELEFKRNFEDFYKEEPPPKLTHQLNGLRPPTEDNIGRWKNHPERIKKQFSECPELFDILIELGYEKDKEWIKEI